MEAIAGQLAHGGGVGAVDRERAEGVGRAMAAVDGQVGGDARAFFETAEGGGLVDAVLGHATIGGPLAAGDGDDARVFDDDGVIARERRGASGIALLDQRADTGEDAEHVGARGRLGEVERGGLQDKVDLLLHRDGFERGLRHRRIGGADNGVAMPRDGEHDAAVAGVRHHDGVIARQEPAVENQVDALAGSDDGRDGGVGHTAD